jgi:hypothetical protein
MIIGCYSLILAIKLHPMKTNMGSIDRIIRVIVAAIVAVLYLNGTVSGTVGIILLVLAGIFVLTSLVSICPLYLPFGISTCKIKKAA